MSDTSVCCGERLLGFGFLRVTQRASRGLIRLLAVALTVLVVSFVSIDTADAGSTINTSVGYGYDTLVEGETGRLAKPGIDASVSVFPGGFVGLSAESPWEILRLSRNLVAPSGTGGIGPVRVGQAGEAAVRGAYDIGPKATVSINGRTRILDGLTDRAVTEVKNVQSLSLTTQIRDNIDYAAQTSRRLDLYVRPDTHLSGPLLEAISGSNGAIQLRFIPQ